MRLSIPLRLGLIGALSLVMTAAMALLLVGGPAHSAPAQQPAPATLRSQVTVDGAVVTLDDVFQGVVAEGTRVIARAPRPGQRTTLEARWLWRTARAHGLAWRPMSRQDVVIVERSSLVVSAQQIRTRLLDALEPRIAGDDVELELDNPDLTVHLPVDADATLKVGRLDYDPRSGRVSAVIGDASGQRLSVTGKVYRMAEAPVPARRLGTGHIVRERDLQWITVRASALDRNVLVDERLIVGQAVRRPLPEGRPIRSGDVESPLLVQRKSMVTITLETPRMKLTAQGRALEDGALGDMVRIENIQSRRTIEATVTGPNAVTVISAHAVLMQ